jgi:hypothetical protein
MRILEYIYDAPSIRPTEWTANGEHVIAQRSMKRIFPVAALASFRRTTRPKRCYCKLVTTWMWTTVATVKLGDRRAVTRKKGQSEIEHVVDSTRKIGNMN